MPFSDRNKVMILVGQLIDEYTGYVQVKTAIPTR